MMNPNILEASYLLGGSREWTRSLCRRGAIGDAWSTVENPKRKAYVVVPSKLAAYMEISVPELESRLAQLRKRWGNDLHSIY